MADVRSSILWHKSLSKRISSIDWSTHIGKIIHAKSWYERVSSSHAQGVWKQDGGFHIVHLIYFAWDTKVWYQNKGCQPFKGERWQYFISYQTWQPIDLMINHYVHCIQEKLLMHVSVHDLWPNDVIMSLIMRLQDWHNIAYQVIIDKTMLLKAIIFVISILLAFPMMVINTRHVEHLLIIVRAEDVSHWLSPSC